MIHWLAFTSPFSFYSALSLDTSQYVVFREKDTANWRALAISENGWAVLSWAVSSSVNRGIELDVQFCIRPRRASAHTSFRVPSPFACISDSCFNRLSRALMTSSVENRPVSLEKESGYVRVRLKPTFDPGAIDDGAGGIAKALKDTHL